MSRDLPYGTSATCRIKSRVRSTTQKRPLPHAYLQPIKTTVPLLSQIASRGFPKAYRKRLKMISLARERSPGISLAPRVADKNIFTSTSEVHSPTFGQLKALLRRKVV